MPASTESLPANGNSYCQRIPVISDLRLVIIGYRSRWDATAAKHHTAFETNSHSNDKYGRAGFIIHEHKPLPRLPADRDLSLGVKEVIYRVL